MNAQLGTIDPRSLDVVGSGLHEPECVLCTSRGDIFVSDRRGGITRIDTHHQCTFLAGDSRDLAEPLRPNGVALDSDGTFVIAHLGRSSGGVYRLQRRGQLSPVIQRVDGIDLPPTNFPLLDDRGRLWVTVSTHKRPRTLGYRLGDGDGFIVLVDDRGARIVADGLGYTNELRLHPDGGSLYVNETFGRRLTRFRLHADGRLSGRETVAEFGVGIFLDGLAFDSQGHAWVTSVVSNQLIRIAPDGSQKVILADSDDDHVAWVEQALQEGRADRGHIGKQLPGRIPNISSIAFGGPDLRHAHLGCFGDHIYRFPCEVPGVTPVHWSYPSIFE